VKTAVILGTRPEIIKMSPIIRELEKRSIDFFILHTGQHYSYNMDRVFFEQLKLPQPKYNLKVGSGSHAEQTGKMLIAIESVLKKEKPSIVLVQGDTNTTLAGALAAVKLEIKVGHVEAGLRSYDRRMPEEINRTLVDHCSNLLFAPTQKSRTILLNEGIPENLVFVTGNTIVDAVTQNLELAREREQVFSELDVDKGKYLLATVHRQENVEDEGRFKNILRGLEEVRKEFGFPIVYPIHPRAKKKIEELRLRVEGIKIIEPLDYLSFLKLESSARLILTDSGGVQEEACILGVPCVTLRYSTERPETLDVGSNVLAGAEPDEIISKTRHMLNRKSNWPNPFGDGRAAERIVNILEKELE
jgi:UDP-N-acetylglucosamine 2-epimerase (non-hydrolysing)